MNDVLKVPKRISFWARFPVHVASQKAQLRWPASGYFRPLLIADAPRHYNSICIVCFRIKTRNRSRRIARKPAKFPSRFSGSRRENSDAMWGKNRTDRYRTQLAANEIIRSEKIKKDGYPCISFCLFSMKFSLDANWLGRWEPVVFDSFRLKP